MAVLEIVLLQDGDHEASTAVVENNPADANDIVRAARSHIDIGTKRGHKILEVRIPQRGQVEIRFQAGRRLYTLTSTRVG